MTTIHFFIRCFRFNIKKSLFSIDRLKKINAKPFEEDEVFYLFLLLLFAVFITLLQI